MVIGGVHKHKDIVLSHSLSGHTAMIHQVMCPKNGINTIRFSSWLLAYHERKSKRHTMYTSFVPVTKHFLLKCWTALLNSSSKLIFTTDSRRLAQDKGIWAWDCVFNELVLVVPEVLAMLGDNPMQSEFACHIGLRGKLFCRVCKVRGKESAEPGDSTNDAGSDHGSVHSVAELSDAGSDAGSGTRSRKKGKKAIVETFAQMKERVNNFIKVRINMMISAIIKTSVSLVSLELDQTPFSTCDPFLPMLNNWETRLVSIKHVPSLDSRTHINYSSWANCSMHPSQGAPRRRSNKP